MTPNFLIIGAAKAATTSLSSMLNHHPEVGIVKGKEPHFFSIDQVYARGWEWYQSQYQGNADKKVLGDASTSYSRLRYHPKTIERILKHSPDVKIIYMVRHPIERMVSAYMERMATGGEQTFPSINHAVVNQPMIINSSRYWEVFDAYRQSFGEENIKVVWFEEFTKYPNAVFAEVCEFLGVDSNVVIETDAAEKNTRDHVKQRIEKLGRTDLKTNLEWDPRVESWVREQIEEDKKKFLTHFNRPNNYWA